MNVYCELGKFFCCGKSVHKVRDCPTFKGQDKLRVQAQDIGSNVYAQKRITFMLFALGVSKRPLPPWWTSMLKVFCLDIYYILDPGATLSFVTPLVAKKFEILPDILYEPFIVSNPLGDSVVEKHSV